METDTETNKREGGDRERDIHTQRKSRGVSV